MSVAKNFLAGYSLPIMIHSVSLFILLLVIIISHSKSVKKSWSYGLSFGFSQAIAFFAYAAAFRFGAWLVVQGLIDFDNVFKFVSVFLISIENLVLTTICL